MQSPFRPSPLGARSVRFSRKVQLEEEKAQLQESLEAVHSRFSVVRGQLGSLRASMGGTPVPLMKGLHPRTGTPLEQQNELLQAKVDAEQTSRKSLRTAIHNIVDWIDKPASSSERPVIYGHAEESED
jgi:hypothetical protein